MNSWRVALRIAFREGRASRGKFAFVILAVAIGVASVTGVRGFSEAFRGLLLREARTLMAADMTVRSFEQPTAAQEAVMQDLQQRGAARTVITETVSMIAARAAGNPVLVSIKAVDPAVYPFYGQVRLNPPGALRETLTADTVVVSDDLLLRLGANAGDTVQLGEGDYRIAAVVAMEPDRMTGSLNVGPRVMLSRAGLDRSGLIVAGSRASQRFLFRLPRTGLDVNEARRILKKAFPESMIADYRETHPVITRGLDHATTFLTLVGLVSLIVGAIGVATAMHAHLRMRMDSIAVMKCLGGRSSQIIRIYVLQTLLLGLAGSLIGIVIGLAVQSAFPVMIARYFPVRPGIRFNLLSSLQGLGAGLLTTLLFTWPPLAAIRRMRPALILRRDMPEARPSWKERRENYRSVAAGAVAILVGLALIAATLSGGSWLAAVYFTGGLVVSLAVLMGIGRVLLVVLKAALKRLGARMRPSLRHGLANLHRPGNQATFVLASLGLGVMFTLTIFLVQRSMLAQVFASAPPGMPNVFLINVTARERAGLLELIRTQPGVETPPEVTPAVPARLTAVDAVPIATIVREDNGPSPGLRRMLRTRSVTWSADKPAHTEVMSGAWWRGKPAEPEVAISQETAGLLKLRPGARLDFESSGRTISARVAAVFRTEAIRPGSNIEFVFTPGALDGLPAIYFGGLRVNPKQVPALQRAVYQHYPTVTVINAADVLAIVQEVVDRIALVVRFVSFFTIFAGAVILASSVAGTRLRRIREVAILKALGATRLRVAGIFSMEFLVLGAVAGLMGGLLASAFSALLLHRFFSATLRFDPAPVLWSIAAAALIATAAGWLAGYRLLQAKPLAVLREE